MRADDLDRKSSFRRETLDEGPMDTLKTTARSIGSRVGNAALATAGGLVGRGGRAQGRLRQRIAADQLLQRFFKWAGNTPATRRNVYRYLKKNWGAALDDRALNNITGVGQADPVPPDEPAAQPVAQPVAPPAASPAAATVAPAATPQPQPPPPPTTTTTAPAPSPVPQPATANPPPAQASAPAPTQPELTPDGRQKLTPAQYQAMVKQAGGNPNRITPAMVDQTAASPPPAPPAQPALSAASPQPQAPSQPAAPRLPTLVTSVVNAIRQHVDSDQIMQMINHAVQQTAAGSPQRQNLVTTIKAMQQNSKFVNKLPQLSELTLETWTRQGHVLREQEEELQRSELDQMFMQAADIILKDQGDEEQSQPGGHANDGDNESSGADDGDAFEQSLDKRITLNPLTNAAKKLKYPNDSAQMGKVMELFKAMSQNNPTLRDLMTQVQRKLGKKLRPNVQKALVLAADNYGR
jgi:hypothetical protein